ncbi:PAS domain-containing protein [Acetonema longum]|uniref:Signal transduction histidine kinase, nitrogen specific, NtrB n=1 Tax=Acetonema longum DSM 6540 TaxID=1009370 RepID=F7NE80_9FIRM|nr:PAS domain-containing protein [Acetonema longum]EGO65592.1 signal transduction histidine kinase, nitrogen specific, NtrB [Acetonema longum DSM 6540]
MVNGLEKLEKLGLHTIFELIPAGLCIAADTSCKEIIYNSIAAQFLRIQTQTASPTPDKPYRIFRDGRELSPADRPLERAAWLGDEVFGDQLELVWEDGIRKYAIWNSRPLRDAEGSIIAAICTFEDITEKKRMLGELERHSEQLNVRPGQYQLLLHSIPCLIFLLNKAGVIEFANECADQFFKGWMGRLSGLPLIGAVIPRDRLNGKSLSQIVGRSRFSRKGSLVSSYRLPNGQQVWIQWQLRRYTDPVTGVTGIICAGCDITDRENAEQAFHCQHKRRERIDLLNKALRGEIGGQELVEAARRVGISLTAGSLLYIIQIRGVTSGGHTVPQDKPGQRCQAKLDRLITEIERKTVGIVWPSCAGIAVLEQPPSQENISYNPQDQDIAEILLSLVRTVFSDKRADIGTTTVTGDPPNMALAYQQAMFALRAGQAIHKGKGGTVYHWQDLGMLQLMSAYYDSDQSRAFVQAELGALLEHDKIKASSLVDTLEAVLTADSAAAVARQLHVHEKTVLFRKRKIERILGTNIDNQDKQLNLLMAIKLLRLMQFGDKN